MEDQKLKRPPTFDHLMSSKKPNTRKLFLPLDSEIAERYDEVKNRRDVAKIRYEARKDPQTAEEFAQAQAAFDQVEADLRENSVLFTFKAIGRKNYEKLVSKHPPTNKQKEEVEDAGGDPKLVFWNTDTFPPALIAASCVSPEMTPEQAKVLWEDDENWNSAELSEIFNAALMANTTRKVTDLGNA